MRLTILAIAVLLAAAPAAANERTGVVATVHQFVDGFNKGDVKTALAACASPASIVDEVPPHAWQGSTACADWANSYAADSKKRGISDGIVVLAVPRHVDIHGNFAYVVVPATYTYKQHGKPVTQSGSILTAALAKISGVWRITGWAWTRN